MIDPTDSYIVKACREILWPGGDKHQEWNADHLESLASLLEPPPNPFEHLKILRDMARDVLNADQAGPDQMREALQELRFAIEEAESKIPELAVN